MKRGFGKRIVVTGGAGFLGRQVVAELRARGAKDILVPRAKDHDLRESKACRAVVRGADLVIHLAARVGGIGYNRAKPAELFHDNALMGLHLLDACRRGGVRKVVLIGTICAYPKFTPVPFREEDLWAGYPEETNAPYGLAKKMLLVAAQAYRQQYKLRSIYLLPVNLYGPHDNFDLESSHVIPAMIRKMLEAKDRRAASVTLWGTGKPSREFLYVEDAAEGIVSAAERYDGPEPVNLGTGREIVIRDLASLVAQLTGFKGDIVWDASQPDGQPRRSLEVSKARERFGFTAKTSLEEGLAKTITWWQKTRRARGAKVA